MSDSPHRRAAHRALTAAVSMMLLPVVAGCGEGQAPSFSSETVAEGVRLFRPADEGPNSTVIVRADGLLLIDAQPDERRARALAAAIRAELDAPVRYVVLSHPHREAAGGVAVFEDALLIASVDAAAALADPGFDYDAELGPFDGESARPTPTLIVGGEIELDDERMPVRIVRGDSGHSPGELIVGVHEGSVLHAGGLPFADGKPYGGTANVSRWIGSLNRLSRQAPTTVIGTRGPALDIAGLRRQRNALAWLRSQVQDAHLRGTPYDAMGAEIAAQPDAPDHFDLAGGPEHLEGLARRAVEEFRDQRNKRGLD